MTDRGRIEAEYVVIACGVWSPRIARMAGASIPLTPAVHQMIDVGPIPVLQESGKELAFPIVRDMDVFMYERQTGGSMEVGSYAHRPIFHRPDDIPSIAESRFSPTELPFTDEDFDEQMEDALELMPDILSTAEIKYATNGLLSLTPDAMPLIGETVEVKNLWSAAAIWIKEGPGTGRAVAEWMTHGYPELDPHASDIARFYPYARTERHVIARCTEHFNKTYGIVHPREQWASERNKRMSPFHARTEALGAFYFEAGGWERPHWYESNAGLVSEYGVEDRPHEWDRRWWSPIQNAEHLALRERVGMVDLSPFVVFDFNGPGTLAYLQYLTVNNVDVAVGRSVYTPLLTESGGFKADLTVLRLGEEHFRVVTGAFDGPRDKHWFRRHLPEDGSVQMTDLTSALVTIGVWGPKARDLVQSVTEHDLSNAALSLWPDAGDRLRFDQCPIVPHLLRRRPRLRDLRSHRAGPADVGSALEGGPGPRRRSGRGGCLWHHRASGEGLPVDGGGVGKRVQPGRSGSGATDGEDRRLRREDGLSQSPGGGAGGDLVHADRRGSSIKARWDQALHDRARADHYPLR